MCVRVCHNMLLLPLYRLMFDRHSKTDSLLIVQCDSGHLYGDLIACARYRVDDERERSSHRWTRDSGRTHVLFIVHLPRRGGGDGRLGSFFGFQGGKWLSGHIDDLRAPREASLSLDEALHTSISDLFYSEGTAIVSKITMKQELEEKDKDMEDVEMDEENVGKEEEHVEKEEEDMEMEEEDVEDMEKEEKQIEMEVEDMEEEERHGEKEEEETPVAHTASSKASYQCSRLYSCIQAAVAHAGNSKAIRRVEILLNLIPQQPKFPLMSMGSLSSDNSLFYATLVRHIHFVLQQREKVVGEETEWVIEEAMNGKKLHSGGTFRNVLSRRLDEVIIPIFAEVLVHVDRYSNLDLLARKGAPPHVQQLWLSAFACLALCSFSYTDVSQGGGGLAGMGQSKSSAEEFSCQFPFFWLIKETVDSHWDAAVTVTGETH